MFRSGSIGSDEGEADRRFRNARQLALCTFGGFLETLQCEFVAFQIDVVLGRKAFDQPVHYPLVKIFAAEERVAGRRENLKHAVVYLKYRDIERTAAKVINGDLFGLAFAKTIGKCGGRRLVDDALDLEAGDLTSVTRRLALHVV